MTARSGGDGALHLFLNLIAFAAWLVIACAAVAGPTLAVRDQFGPTAAAVTAQVCATAVCAVAITWGARRLTAAGVPACSCLDSPRRCPCHPAPGGGRHHREETP
jgi:hypothetical protein